MGGTGGRMESDIYVVLVVSCFGYFVARVGVYKIVCVVWCTNDMSFVFVVMDALGIGREGVGN